MPPEPSGVEQAVSRALRDNLGRLQRTADELAQAIADLVAACGSSRPSNALPPMLRAQTAAASLAAALEVLSRFVTAALQPAQRTLVEEEMVRLVSVQPPERPAEPSLPPRSIPTPMGEVGPSEPQASVGAPTEVVPPADTLAEAAQVAAPEAVGAAKPDGDGAAPASGETAAQAAVVEPPAEELIEVGELLGAFDMASLSPEQQQMHRRANRVAKVSMQDIKLLRPAQVRLGCEHKDLCLRLRDDIEKARKEYDRRFRPIMGHPVDYFYHWMVEILADGDPEALGEYPYPSPVLRR